MTTRLASFLTTSHHRPHLLRAAVLALLNNTPPAGWRIEIVVAHHEGDGAEAALESLRGTPCPITTTVRRVATSKVNAGGKRDVAFKASRGELVMIADDDDIQCVSRAQQAIAAYELGRPVTAVKTFRYLNTETGEVCLWQGGANRRIAPVAVGTARNLSRKIVERVGGYRDVPRLVEKDLQLRLHRFGVLEHDLGAGLGKQTICLQHGANIWDDRPFPAAGVSVRRGNFELVGEGHWTRVLGFPMIARRCLEDLLSPPAPVATSAST